MTSHSAPTPQRPERMLRLFACEHVRPDLAHYLAGAVPAGPERTVSLRKLLEASCDAPGFGPSGRVALMAVMRLHRLNNMFLYGLKVEARTALHRRKVDK